MDIQRIKQIIEYARNGTDIRQKEFYRIYSNMADRDVIRHMQDNSFIGPADSLFYNHGENRQARVEAANRILDERGIILIPRRKPQMNESVHKVA